MTRFLLDTNILSDLVRNPQGRVAARIAEIGEAEICTGVIVAAELRFGAAKKGSERLTRQIDSILSLIDIQASTRRPTTLTRDYASNLKPLGRQSAETTC